MLEVSVTKLMNPATIVDQLEKIQNPDDFVRQTYGLTEQWSKDPNSFEAVEPILRFMESHPNIDYGVPGPLVHFVEGFLKHGYEEKLLESIERHPTGHTVWMLNRLINGTKDRQERQRLISVLQRAGQNPLADAVTRDQVTEFLTKLLKLS